MTEKKEATPQEALERLTESITAESTLEYINETLQYCAERTIGDVIKAAAAVKILKTRVKETHGLGAPAFNELWKKAQAEARAAGAGWTRPAFVGDEAAINARRDSDVFSWVT